MACSSPPPRLGQRAEQCQGIARLAIGVASRMVEVRNVPHAVEPDSKYTTYSHDETKEHPGSGFGSGNLIPSFPGAEPCSGAACRSWDSPVLSSTAAADTVVIMEPAKGLVVGDPILCVGCGRCELACTEFNLGKASPTLSRIKIGRHLNFGADAVSAWREGQGDWGDGLVVQELVQAVPPPGALRQCLPGGCHRPVAFDQRANGRSREVHGLPDLPGGLSLGDGFL